MLHDHANIFILMFWMALVLHVGFFLFAKKNCRSSWHVFVSSLILAISTTGLIGWLLADHYTGEGINDAALFQLTQGMTGLQASMLLPIVAFLVGAYALVVGFAVVLHKAQKKNKLTPPPSRPKKTACLLCYALLSVAVLTVNPGWAQTGSMLTMSYLARLKVENVMGHARLPQPPPTSITPLSVVYIYAEGLEGTFLNEEAFPDLTPNLNRLAKKGLRIHGIKQVSFTGWTIAGQIASNCGFPGAAGTVVFAANSARWPCASNILAQENYYMVYLNGSSLDFSGKGEFWKARGYQELYGDETINKLADFPLKRLSEWGAYDDALMTAAKKEYQRLQQAENPFVLTLLTVDTHAPQGMGTPSCINDSHYRLPNGEKAPQLLQAVHCADKVIGNFLDDLLENLPQDTIVVLQSDHLQTPRTDAFMLLENTKNRENLFLAWGKDIKPQELNRKATSFDIAPTFLSLLGRNPKALNLGRDLLSPEPTLVETYGYPWMEERMKVALTDSRMTEFARVESTRAKEIQMRHQGLDDLIPSRTGDPELRKRLEEGSVK